MYGDVFVGMRTIERLIVDEFVLVFFLFVFHNVPAQICSSHQSLFGQYWQILAPALFLHSRSISSNSKITSNAMTLSECTQYVSRLLDASFC